MNYGKIYDLLINRAQTREEYIPITEQHHILPRSEGGSNKKSNKVELTPKEHHLCHLLLIRLGMCMKYCFRNMTTREYVIMKLAEKKKKHLI